MDDPFRLQRFVDAQQTVYGMVLGELRAGHKRTHWIWFIFPQIAGLGKSAMSREFSVCTLEEASTYLAHPLLGPRLRECSATVVGIEGRSITEILGYPDNVKFRSSMTLFSRAAPEEPIFASCLEKYFAGEPDPQTLELLSATSACPGRAGPGTVQHVADVVLSGRRAGSATVRRHRGAPRRT